MPYAIFLFLCLVWGSNFILMDRASFLLGPIDIGAIRLFLAAIVVGLACVWKGSWTLPTWRNLGHFLVAGIIGFSLPFGLQPYLVSTFGHGYIGMMVCLVPILTIALSIPMLAVYPTRRQFLGVVGGLGFLGLMLWDGHQRSIPLRGLSMAVTVPLAYAFVNIYIKRNLQEHPLLPLTLINLVIGLVALIPFWFLSYNVAQPGPSPDTLTSPPAIALALFQLGVVGTGVATLLFYHMIRHQGPLFAGMVTYVVTPCAIAWSWLDDERVSPVQLAALLGTLTYGRDRAVGHCHDWAEAGSEARKRKPGGSRSPLIAAIKVQFRAAVVNTACRCAAGQVGLTIPLSPATSGVVCHHFCGAVVR